MTREILPKNVSLNNKTLQTLKECFAKETFQYLKHMFLK